MLIAPRGLGLNPAQYRAGSFSFTTEIHVSIRWALISATATAADLIHGAAPHPGSPPPPFPGLHLARGTADLYVGVAQHPVLLEQDRAAPPNTGTRPPVFLWIPPAPSSTRFNPLPVPTATLQIPGAEVSVPNAISLYVMRGGTVPPAGAGWPALLILPARHHPPTARTCFAVADFLCPMPALRGWWRSICHCNGITKPVRPPWYATGANPPVRRPSGLPARAAPIEGPQPSIFSTAPRAVIDPSRACIFINLTSLPEPRATQPGARGPGRRDLVTLGALRCRT